MSAASDTASGKDGKSQKSLILEEHEDGEARLRSCTDICCLTIFVVFLCGMGHIWMESQDKGDLAKLTSGFDWRGHICGVGEDVRDLPVLFWCTKLDPESGFGGLSLTDGICVESCPTSTSTQHFCPDAPQFFATNTSSGDGGQLVSLGVTRALVPRSDYPTMKLPGLGYCFPDPSSEQYRDIMGLIANQTALGQQGQSLMTMAHGVAESWRFLLVALVLATISGYIFLFLLKTFIKPFIVTLAVLMVGLVVGLGGYVLYSAWHPSHNIFTHVTSEADQAKLYAQIAGGVILALAFPVVCLVMAARKAIEVTVQCVQESCNFVVALPSLLLQPITQIVVKSGLFLVLVYGLVWVISMGDVRPDTSIDPLNPDGWVSMEAQGFTRGIVLKKEQKIMVVYWFCGSVWLVEIFTAAGQFALSHAVVLRKVSGTSHWLPLVHGYFNAFVFHLGTLAFGGFIIGVLKILTMIVAFIAKQLKNPDGSENKVAKCCACCCVALLTCVTKLMEYINEMVYTECCIHGTGYITSSRNALWRLTSNPIVFATVKGTTSVVSVLGTGIITITGTWVVYKIQFDGWSSVIAQAAEHAAEATSNATGVDFGGDHTGDMVDILTSQSAMGTTIAAGIIFLYVSQCFMEVFEHTANSLAYTILWLRETPDGKDKFPEPQSWSEAAAHHGEAQVVAPAGEAPYTQLA